MCCRSEMYIFVIQNFVEFKTTNLYQNETSMIADNH